MTLPTDPKARKEMPIARGVMDYFPDALAAVANVSFVGNQQHNPGEEMRWAREKSRDHADCIARHLLERGGMDTDGMRHSAKLAWRALALLQLEIEADEEKIRQGIDPATGRSASEVACDAAWQGRRSGVIIHKPGQEDEAQRFLDECRDAAPGEYIRMPPPGVQAVQFGGESYPYLSNFGPNPLDTPVPFSSDPNATPEQEAEAKALWDRVTSRPKRVYIAGPMRGYANYNKPAFDEARDLFIAEGWDVISPCDIEVEEDGPEKFETDQHNNGWMDTSDQSGYIRRDVEAILSCDAIAMLDGWERSTGATAEFMVARWAKKSILDRTGSLLDDYNALTMQHTVREHLENQED